MKDVIDREHSYGRDPRTAATWAPLGMMRESPMGEPATPTGTSAPAWGREKNDVMRWFGMILVLAVLSTLVAPALPASSAGAASGETVFMGVRVFDGERVIPNATVIVAGDRIAAVEGPESKIQIPEHATIVKGGNRTLLPGLIDAHTHSFGDALQQAVVFGVTTELDMFTQHTFAAAMRKQQAEGQATDRADLVSAGTLVTAPGGHGTEYGIPIPTIADPSEAQAFVDARLEEGSDFIKIVYDDGRGYGRKIPTVSKATMAAVVEAAHKRGRLAVVHIHTLADARDAIEVGADGLVHIFADEMPTKEFVALVAEHKAFVIPTLSVTESVMGKASGASLLEDPSLGPAIMPAVAASLKRSFPFGGKHGVGYEAAKAAVRELKAAGVPILAGTDAPNPGTGHGVSMHREMELLVEAGLTATEALAAATSVPADRFRLSDRGRIRKGLRSDLLLVEGDPTVDITATRRIAGVWKAGVAVDRKSFVERVAEARRAAESAPSSAARTGSGLVSRFEDGKVAAEFGSGWQVSTDSIMSGTSKAEMAVVAGGAAGSSHALRVHGEVGGALPFAWAGAIFLPGDGPMRPTNLSNYKRLVFWARGDGRPCQLMLFVASKGPRPVIRPFTPGREWTRFEFAFSDFDGMDGRDLSGVLFSSSSTPGPFEFFVDEIAFE